MNNYGVETRRRSRSLLIVEGKHEKDELFWLVFKCFPELNIDINDVWIYGTNIYKLYEDIVREYGNSMNFPRTLSDFTRHLYLSPGCSDTGIFRLMYSPSGMDFKCR